MPKPIGAEQGGLGTGKVLCLKPFGAGYSLITSGAEQGGSGTGKILCLKPLGLSKVV